MLALSSSSVAFAPTISMPYPVKAAAAFVTELSTVGVDMRRMRTRVHDLTSPVRSVKRTTERIAQAIVMTASISDRVGDLGFDPLNLGTEANFISMREAELKHGRLAMLAAVAWPLQEILHPILVDAFYAAAGIDTPDLLMESNGASPSLLNGGLDQPELLPALALALIGASIIEESDMAKRASLGLRSGVMSNEYPADRTAGDLGFDPLRLYSPLSAVEQRNMQERELCNGRVAMLAVLSYVTTEALTGIPVVRMSKELFQPIILNDGFRSFMDTAFSMATMEGSIDGVAI